MKRLFLLILLLTSFEIITAQPQSVTIRLSSETGQDAYIATNYLYSPYPMHKDLTAISWHIDSLNRTEMARNVFQFYWQNLIPANAQIISATLSLYANPTPVNNNHTSPNASIIRRVMTSWDQNTVTWLKMPSYTPQDEVILAPSTSSNQDYLNINVTKLVKEMFRDPAHGHGFMLMLEKENANNSCINFASGDCAIVDKRPKLVIQYTTTSGLSGNTNEIPESFTLSQNYPNPFNPSTTIKFNIAKATHLNIKVFDALGREVAKLYDDEIQPGSYTKVFDASQLQSGHYYYRLETPEFSETKKMILVK